MYLIDPKLGIHTVAVIKNSTKINYTLVTVVTKTLKNTVVFFVVIFGIFSVFECHMVSCRAAMCHRRSKITSSNL